MKNCFKLYTVFIVLFLIPVALLSQPPLNSKKRMQTLKKMKMLEVIDLEEDQTNKFLIKYDHYEDLIREQRRNLNNIRRELQRSLNDNNDSKINEQTKKYLEAKSKMHKILEEKMEGMSKVLDDKNYAKFILFEDKFHQRLQKEIMKRAREIIKHRRQKQFRGK